MASVQLYNRAAPAKRRLATADSGVDASGDLARLAAQARDVFATRSDLCGWLLCAARQRAQDSGGRRPVACDEVSAAACAVTFGVGCPQSSTPRQFARTIAGLPTPQLEALLALNRHAGF